MTSSSCRGPLRHVNLNPNSPEAENMPCVEAPSFTSPPTGSAFRGVLVTPLIAVWVLFASSTLALLALCFRRWTRKNLQALIGAWGRVPLFLAGVRVELHGEEHLQAPGPKLFLFNHVSTLDLFLLAAHAPPLPCVAYKREFHFVPGIGWALYALRMIEIDRRDAERSIKSLERAGERLANERLSLMMAPEGTRSRRGGLQAFKKGPFHVAIATGAPIYPMILRGIEEVCPMGSWIIKSGVIRADCLPPIDTSGWETDTINEHIKATRAVFLKYLPPEKSCS
jgi:putative phosphoserine phosphatase/1-acylglycerol-3-phosphate O-acyltransferase